MTILGQGNSLAFLGHPVLANLCLLAISLRMLQRGGRGSGVVFNQEPFCTWQLSVPR